MRLSTAYDERTRKTTNKRKQKKEQENDCRTYEESRITNEGKWNF